MTATNGDPVRRGHRADARRGPRPSRWRGAGHRIGEAAAGIDRATPATRERAIDGLRALAICGVVLGHWLVTALVVWEDGGLRVSSPLRDMPGLAPLSWVLQLLGLFFLVGGYVAARSLARSRERGQSDGAWLRARLGRLLRPLIAVAAVWGLIAAVLPLLGVPEATMRTGVLLTGQPMWFIAVYLAVTALTRYVVAADLRFGAVAVLVPLAAVAAVDLLCHGPWQEAVPGWLGMVNVLPAWLFGYQLGVSWAHGRLSRPIAVVLLIAGAVGLAVLVTRLGYPVSAVGVPGAERSNAHPPSLFVPTLAAAQIGAAVLLRDPLERLLRRSPLLWAGVAALNLGALTVFCWHQSALVAVSAAGSVWGVLPGLTAAADGPAWIAARLLWLPVFGAVLLLLVAALRRYEGPWERTALRSATARTAAVLAAAGFLVALVRIL
ncbi:peptidoglycan/LPS O-acetylase OafA/YrhL [Spinactinospora alkalitolerans]|uniref:Peptidoglycan/LPS O-acetylase OafA/YrhL n=1 Tax=Spinactinospora alkalitolerans TaxID=687207 RepID=A0A852TSN0_9ACTN|nr:acyltransferase [Spinactinospora alkalitolerans]NYE45743.1 peptidoglycan/LPS O-acetylase OafA/YrhL [Spinactinospora alkalitolerans]